MLTAVFSGYSEIFFGIHGNKIFSCSHILVKKQGGIGMSDYRRFVSYIYEYNHGRKSRNTGFAKVESRGGILKLQIHMQGMSAEEGALEIYAFVREGEWLEGILLGKTGLQTSSGEIRLMTPAEHVGNVNYSLDQLSGLWISSERGGTYLSIWDEEPVDLGKLRPFVEKSMVEEQDSNNAQKEAMRETSEDLQNPEEILDESQSIGIPQELPSETADVAEQEEGEEAAEHTTDQDEDSKEAAGEIAEQERAEAGEEKKTEQPEALAESNEGLPEEQEREVEIQAGDEKRQAAEEAADVKAAQSACAAEACVSPHPCANCHKYQSALDQRWKQLSGCRGHVQPFDSEQIVDCLQVSPRELGILYQSRYPVGRNSFLMHGYYNYRHLLFGKCKDGSYFLGVPGVFENQEKMMAAMFGFPEFRKAREQRQGRGPFGYWCRRLG